jgi:hypothetical protein
MKVYWLIATALLSLLLVSIAPRAQQCRVSQKVVADIQPGYVAAEFAFSEIISLEGTHLTLTRIGGNKIRRGTWSVLLTDKEIQETNKLISQISPVADADHVSKNGMQDAPRFQLTVGANSKFVSGWVGPSGGVIEYHEFSDRVRALFQFLRELAKSHGLDEVRANAS